MTLFQQFLAQAAAFTRKHVREESTLWRWATVTAVDPALIRYDGTPSPAIIPPTVLGPPVTVGDRVRTATIRGQTVIIGRAGSGDTGWVSIPPASGYSSPDPVMVVREGRLAVLRGSLQRTGGSFHDALGDRVFTVPAGFRPASYVRAAISSYSSVGAANYYLAVTEEGVASIGRMGDGTGADVYLTGVSWPIF